MELLIHGGSHPSILITGSLGILIEKIKLNSLKSFLKVKRQDHQLLQMIQIRYFRLFGKTLHLRVNNMSKKKVNKMEMKLN
jgi:hypothetical protein